MGDTTAQPPNAASRSPKRSSASPKRTSNTSSPGSTGDTVAGADVVEVDAGEENDPEADSAFGDDQASETTSLASTIRHHKFENGRRYHSYKSGKYIMPNDEQELDRLDIHHHIALLHLDGELFSAPISENPESILDIGTGTGIWAIDMGDKFPNATVTGVDLSPTQPYWIPPNVQFEIDDVEEEWNFRSQFDFIHARYLAGSIRDWPKLIEQVYKQLKPGGWAEFKDWDVRPYNPAGELNIPENYVKKWHDLVIGGCEDLGATPNPALIIPDLCKSTGFTNLKDDIYQVPGGAWPKDPKKKLVGKFYGLTLYEGAPAMSMRLLTHFKGWEPKEVDILNARFREDMKKTHFYHRYHVIYAQKPIDDES